MIETLLLITGMYLLLTLVGWCALAPADDETRSTLLPAAPVLGAALVAAVSSTATRWLTIPMTLIVVGLLLAALVGIGLWRQQRPWRVPRAAAIALLICPLLTLGGAAVAALPTFWVGDNRPVAATVIVDQFYFAATSTYLTDESMLPGPYWNAADWAGSATPSVGPVVDVLSNRFRYGQASVSSALSFVLGRDASETVTPISIMLLIMVGGAVFAAASLFGVRRRWALVAVPLVTSSMYLTTQSLEGKNDGLLGVSVALLALGLSAAVTQHRRLMWPLVLSVAGLAAIYSELVFVLVLPVLLQTLIGSRAQLLARLNVVAASWALGVVVTPWAWIWLAQSARIGGRFSDGSTPFEDRQGASLLRAVVGADPNLELGGAAGLFTVVSVVCGVAVVIGLVSTIMFTPARGAAIGLVLAVGFLEVSALNSGAGNLQYRAVQLGSAFILVFAVLGWDAMMQRWPALGKPRPGRSVRVPVAAAAVLAVVGVFAVSNVATAATHLSEQRAQAQHVPAAELDEAAEWVREVGPSRVSVVVPKFTDLIWLALELQQEDGVGYPVVPAIYLGSFPRWDRQPDAYYLTGVGTTLSSDDLVVRSNARYQLVRMNRPDDMILTPFQPTYYWSRPTYMRGFPCARNGSQLLLLRGSQRPDTFDVASLARSQVRSNVGLDIDGTPVPQVGAPTSVGRWQVQTFRAPRYLSSIMNINISTAASRAGTTAVPIVFGRDLATSLPPVDADLASFCLADEGGFLDGYDRDLTTLRTD